VIFDFITALAEKVDEICRKAEVALELWQHKKIARLLGFVITSYDTLPKTYLIPAYLVTISVTILIIIASVRPMVGLLLANLIAYVAKGLGAASIIIFLFGAITSTILSHRLSKRESGA